MIIQNNVLKEFLKNVYFITGMPCGGKTTISRALAKKHGFMVFDIDEQFGRHQQMSNPELQPSMNKKFRNADEFFGRSVEEYKQWLINNTREQLDFVILDLIRLSQDQIIICDCHLTLEQAKELTDVQRVAFLLRDPSNIIDDYCNRKDHQDFNNYINSCKNVENAKRTCNETLKELNETYYYDIKNSQYFWIERNEDSTIEKTVNAVEKHFNW